MAKIKAKNPITGAIFEIEESNFKSQYEPLGWTLASGSTTNSNSNTGNQASTGWVDPATGKSTAKGVGEPSSEWSKRNSGEVSSDDKAWINAAYNKYFDRPATSAEFENWAKETPEALNAFLNKEQEKLGYVSHEMGENKKRRYDESMSIIDDNDLPDDIKRLLKNVVGMYPDATEFNTEEIIKSFNEVKNETIDPYFKELADIAIKDVQTSVSQMKKARELELESEGATADSLVEQAKDSLESRGMTFSGEGVKALGTDSAYADTGSGENIVTPFAGIDPELMKGSVGQYNRLISTSTAARHAADQQTLGRKAEDYLGGSRASNITGLDFAPAGVSLTGQLDYDKEGRYAGTMQNIINQWRAKQQNALNK